MKSSRHASARRVVVRTSSAAALTGACLSLAPAPATATDYEFNPRVELGAGYDDNANLATGLGIPEPGTTLVTPASIRENLGLSLIHI